MSDPIFKSIFGAAWDELSPVMKKHYANRPYTDDVTVVNGHLDVSCAGPIKWFVLGWPAFIGLVAVFFLMVMKPV